MVRCLQMSDLAIFCASLSKDLDAFAHFIPTIKAASGEETPLNCGASLKLDETSEEDFLYNYKMKREIAAVLHVAWAICYTPERVAKPLTETDKAMAKRVVDASNFGLMSRAAVGGFGPHPDYPSIS